MKNSFNFADWLKQKLEDEKDTVSNVKNKFKSTWDDIKLKMTELKDDSHFMVPFINGLIGDNMAEKGSSALIKMSFRYQARDISIDELKEHYNFKEFDGKVVIMVHGLINDETIWKSNPGSKKQRLGSFLEKQGKSNILYIRYNTGLHISQNGRALSKMIQKLINKHKQIKELIIIGHSMGGLVTRSACYYADIDKQTWLDKLKKVFLIAAPNEGSYVAKAAHLTQYYFRKLDPSEKDKIAKFFDIRSNGVKDLSFGYLVDEDWQNAKNEEEKNPNVTKVYPLEGVEYYLLAGTMADESGIGKIVNFFGDGLVDKESALMSNIFKTNSAKSGKVFMNLFTGRNHLTLIECVEVQIFMLKHLEWD